jgi:choline dehydrogenase-like flavoprotein
VTEVHTDVLVIGSGAGGAVTACRLAEAGRTVTVLEEGPWIDPDLMVPFGIDEFAAKYRHRGVSVALGLPPVAYAEGCCVGGSTEINSGLWHRLPSEFAEEWQHTYDIEEFTPEALGRYAEEVEQELSVSRLPGAPPTTSAVLERGAVKLGWRNVEFPRVFRHDAKGRGVKQTMARTLIPRAVAASAEIIPECHVHRLTKANGRITGVLAERRRPDGSVEELVIRAEHVFVCGGAIQTPALLQRSGIRRHIGVGLKLHPTIKVAARFAHEVDHDGVPMHRITEFSPNLTIGGSASRRSHIALALSDSALDYTDAMENWENVAVYYTAIRSEGSGRIQAVPGLKAPLVTYRLTEGDLSRLARGMIHLGEALLAAGATELYPSVTGGPLVRRADELVQWWDAISRSRANVMTVHMTSSVGIGEAQSRTGADSFGRVWGYENLRINDASLVPDAPGVNPQATIMTIASRNCAQFLA